MFCFQGSMRQTSTTQRGATLGARRWRPSGSPLTPGLSLWAPWQQPAQMSQASTPPALQSRQRTRAGALPVTPFLPVFTGQLTGLMGTMVARNVVAPCQTSVYAGACMDCTSGHRVIAAGDPWAPPATDVVVRILRVAEVLLVEARLHGCILARAGGAPLPSWSSMRLRCPTVGAMQTLLSSSAGKELQSSLCCRSEGGAAGC